MFMYAITRLILIRIKPLLPKGDLSAGYVTISAFSLATPPPSLTPPRDGCQGVLQGKTIAEF
jgi:hypothetical protein